MALSCSKILSGLLTEIAPKNVGVFYSLNFLHWFRTKNKFQIHKKLYENKDFCGEVMSSKDIKIQEFHQYQKPNKAPFATYADLKFLIKRINGCRKNSEKLSIGKEGERILCGYSMFTI